jgi:hypothetical protein
LDVFDNIGLGLLDYRAFGVLCLVFCVWCLVLGAADADVPFPNTKHQTPNTFSKLGLTVEVGWTCCSKSISAK